jgi:hypothetical protein
MHIGEVILQNFRKIPEIFEVSARKGFNLEMDLRFISIGEIVAFHDSNLYYKTGFDKETEKASITHIRQVKYYDNIDGVNYSSTPSVPIFSEILEKVC